jgi:CDP-diacylglycerol--serine O-phosphatidyltransferase
MKRETGTKEKVHFSMLREFHLADFITLANGGCGVGALFCSLTFARTGTASLIYVAFALVLLALVFDVLDGYVARARHQSSILGRELDSLADVISFGVAPAAIAYAVGLDSLLDGIGLVFFTLCGLSRLARYNVSAESLMQAGKVRYYEGTPIPTSVIPLAILVWAFSFERLGARELAGQPYHLAVLPFFVSGCLMVSKTLRIPKP